MHPAWCACVVEQPRRWLRKSFTKARESVVITLGMDTDPSSAITALGALPDTIIRSLVVKRREDEGVTVIKADIEVHGGMLDARVSALENHPDVLSVEVS